MESNATSMRFSHRRNIVSILAASAIALAAAGCNSDSPAGPSGGNEQQAPALPSAERMKFDFDFFNLSSKTDAGAQAAAASADASSAPATQQNYFNARVRLAIIHVVTEFVLTPPIAAFSLALNTTPSPQDDGSYLWVYTYVDGDEEAQIRLRGEPKGDQVAWELRVSSNESVPAIENELWFEGETSGDGEAGTWRFHDFNRPGEPIVARLDWDFDGVGEQLSFTDLDENPGNKLSYSRTGSDHSVDFLDASADTTWFIRWDEADGTGSLRAPDYNGGVEACWDDDQDDIACSPVS